MEKWKKMRVKHKCGHFNTTQILDSLLADIIEEELKTYCRVCKFIYGEELPKLYGSKNQIMSAKRIRSNVVRNIAENMDWLNGEDQIDITDLFSLLIKESKAKWWISNKDKSTKLMLEERKII